jgi:5-methylcytosine-specific restriction endonuclease McrA
MRAFSEEHRRNLSLALKGRKIPLEVRRKIALTWTGRKLSAETKEKISNGRRGKDNPMWRGGVSRGKHSGKEYADWRTSIYERDEYRCSMCGQIGGKLNAHHIYLWSNFPEKRLDIENGKTLCEGCHKKVHSKCRKCPHCGEKDIPLIELCLDCGHRDVLVVPKLR